MIWTFGRRLDFQKFREYRPIPAYVWTNVFRTVIAFLLIAVCCAAGSARGEADPADWIEWQARRTEAIAGTNGWTTLIGLHWLKEGDNFAGTDASNQVVFASDRLPTFVGNFIRHESSVSFAAADIVDIRVKGQRVKKVDLVTDPSPEPTRLQIGRISIIALERGDRIGLRVRDPEAKARHEFKGLRWFPYDRRWRLEGRFVPYPEQRKLRVPDVSGGMQEFVSPGEILFAAQGSEHRLAVALEPNIREFFLMFRDETAGELTYPAGRFLYVAKPDSGEQVIIDFNRAYTPPCGFTQFATCPVPPKENQLPFAVKAGELMPVSLED